MGLRLECVNVDCVDPLALARWWGRLLGREVTVDGPGEFVLDPPAGEAGTQLLFVAVPEAKTVKNRLHLDLRPDDREAEVSRALALGAVAVDVGQGDVPWTVLADPEGNEFCVLGSRG